MKMMAGGLGCSDKDNSYLR